jgi:endonuclease YncB( thermonuclease family)
MPALTILAAAALTCIVVDGDTLRCQGERVRLLGIDAPELPGHCRRGRHCAPGDAQVSKRHLRDLVDGRPVRLERVGVDHYGRTLAVARAGGINLSCAQLAAGRAIYVAKWDNGSRIAEACH